MKIILISFCIFQFLFSQQQIYVTDSGEDNSTCGAADGACKTIKYAFASRVQNSSQTVSVLIITSSTLVDFVELDNSGPRIVQSSTGIATISTINNQSYFQTSGDLTFLNIQFSITTLMSGNGTSLLRVTGTASALNLTNVSLVVDGVLNARFLNYTGSGSFSVSNFSISNLATSRRIFSLSGDNTSYTVKINGLKLNNVTSSGDTALDEIIYLNNATSELENIVFDQISNTKSNVLMAVEGNLSITNSNFSNTDGSHGTMMYISFVSANKTGTLNISNSKFNALKVVMVSIHSENAGSVIITNSSFTNLTSSEGGGAVRVENPGSLKVSNSNFSDCNSTEEDGGDLYILLPDNDTGNFVLDTLVFNNSGFEGNMSHVFLNGTNFPNIVKPEKFINVDVSVTNLHYLYGIDRANNGGNENNTLGTRESLIPFIYCLSEFQKTGECPFVECSFVDQGNGSFLCFFDDTCSSFFPTEETDSCPWDCRIELENWVCVRACTEGYTDINERCVRDVCQINKPNDTFQCAAFGDTPCYAQDTYCASACSDGYITNEETKQCTPNCPQLTPFYSHKTQNMHCPDPCWVEEHSCVNSCNLNMYNAIDVSDHVCYRRECEEISPSANNSCPFGCLYQKVKGKGTCNLRCLNNYVIDASAMGTCIYDPEKKRANITVAIIVVILVIIVIAVTVCVCWRVRHPDLANQQKLPADLYGGKTVQPVSSLYGGVGSSSSGETHQPVTERVDFFDSQGTSTNSTLKKGAGPTSYGSF